VFDKDCFSQQKKSWNQDGVWRNWNSKQPVAYFEWAPARYIKVLSEYILYHKIFLVKGLVWSMVWALAGWFRFFWFSPYIKLKQKCKEQSANLLLAAFLSVSTNFIWSDN
jgi:hypothetical protein